MKAFFARLAKQPRLTTELLLASLIVSILALSSSIFVMQVLGRYVSYGVDATLVTLVIGVIIAILLELAFRQLRLRLARSMGLGNESNLAVGAFGMLVNSKTESLNTLPETERAQLLRNLEVASTAFNANNLCAILDVPFAALFLGVLYLLAPPLGFIATLFVGLAFSIRFFGQHLLKQHQQKYEEINAKGRTHLSNANRSPDTVRAFDPAGWLVQAWNEFSVSQTQARAGVVQKQATIESFTGTTQALLGVAVISVGATLVLSGDLDVGALIGANILAARALAPIVRFAQLADSLSRADVALAQLRSMASLEADEGQRVPARPSNGRIVFSDVAFAYPDMPAPLFESLNLNLKPGTSLLVKGANGTGKSTFLRVCLGLLTPNRGQILADGIDLRQLQAQWWRHQIAYLPQEPHFFDTTIRDNLQRSNPGAEEDALYAVVKQVGLSDFVEESSQGLDMPIIAGGGNLAVGIRKRLALARALIKQAPIAIFDEPTEGLDEIGRMHLYAVMNQLSNNGCTILVASDDPNITQGVQLTLDLNSKPEPRIQMKAAKTNE